MLVSLTIKHTQRELMGLFPLDKCTFSACDPLTKHGITFCGLFRVQPIVCQIFSGESKWCYCTLRSVELLWGVLWKQAMGSPSFNYSSHSPLLILLIVYFSPGFKCVSLTIFLVVLLCFINQKVLKSCFWILFNNQNHLELPIIYRC